MVRKTKPTTAHRKSFEAARRRALARLRKGFDLQWTPSHSRDGLAEKKYPLMEHVEGRTYFHVPGASARGFALLLLWQRHPKRLDRALLEDAVARHGFTKKNAALAVDRLRGAMDVDASGLRLLQPGIREAEALLAKAQTDAATGKKITRRRRRRRRTAARGIFVPANGAAEP